jgi:hypothetical protein
MNLTRSEQARNDRDRPLRKLQLRRTTLRQLTPDDLRRVHGGNTTADIGGCESGTI